MANWLWRTDYGELAYGELENSEMTSYRIERILRYQKRTIIDFKIKLKYISLK